MTQINEAARLVGAFYGRNRIEKAHITAVDMAGEASLHVKFKRAGRECGEIFVVGPENVHTAMAILKGQSAEPLQKFGEQMSSYHEPRQQQQSEIMLDF